MVKSSRNTVLDKVTLSIDYVIVFKLCNQNLFSVYIIRKIYMNMKIYMNPKQIYVTA